MARIGVVVDRNVLVSALGFGGTPLHALLRTFEDDATLLASEDTLAEFEQVPGYDHLAFTDREQDRYPAIVEREARIATPETSFTVIEEDPDDDKFLECAVTGDATHLVSGDRHVLDLGSVRGVEIVAAREFLDRLE